MQIERIVEREGMSPEGLSLIRNRIETKVEEAESLLLKTLAENYNSYQQRFIALKTWREALTFVDELIRENREDQDDG